MPRRLAALSLAALALAGCRFGGILTRNVEQTFQTERAVPNRITDPRRSDAGLAVLWVGHATVLIQIDDRFVLTDPVFTRFVGNISRRLVEPGIDEKNLPKIDVAVISHMHFDHLSLGSLDRIEDKLGMLVVPDGGAAYVPGFSFPVRQLPTWSSVEIDGLRVTSVPVQHVGWRYGADVDWMTAFSGYVVEYRGKSVYFGGDTAHAPEKFRATRAMFPHLDLALLPISPIEPRDFMKRTHVDPSEALLSFVELGAARMVPVHFETFINSIDDPGEPRRVLARLAEERGLADRVVPLQIGEQRVLIPRLRGRSSQPQATSQGAERSLQRRVQRHRDQQRRGRREHHVQHPVPDRRVRPRGRERERRHQLDRHRMHQIQRVRVVSDEGQGGQR
jgi:L-ascorbate metabolism protein UlaG (beta-lactamase superfamily)